MSCEFVRYYILFFCMTFSVAVEGRNEWRQKPVILSWCLWRVARVRLKTSFDDQPAISPFLEVHAVSLLQVSLWTGSSRGEGRAGGGGGEEKREPIEMPKDFDFHMPVIDVMFKSTYWVASTTTAANFEWITQLRSWVNTFFRKIRKSVNSSNI